MPKQDISSRHFQRKISEFCELRIAPNTSKRVLENIRPYLVSLTIYRKSPPLLNGRIDWSAIGQACGIEAELTTELKKQLRPGLDAIIRWRGAAPATEEKRTPKPTVRTDKIAPTRKAASSPSSTRQPKRATADGTFAHSTSPTRGPAPKPISPFPEPLFEPKEDPASFQDALAYHMRWFGDTYWQLYRAVVQLNETFDNKRCFRGSKASVCQDLSQVMKSSDALSDAIAFRRDISRKSSPINHARFMATISVMLARLSGAGCHCISRMIPAACHLPSVRR